MALSLSKRSQCVLQSEIRNMSIECEKVKGLNLSQGVCDTEVPEVVRRAAQRAMDQGVNIYTRYDGLPVLRQALAAKIKKLYGLKVDSEREIIASAGSTGAFYCACMALLDPGDEVILFEPYYGYHLQTLLATGVVPKYVKLSPPNWSFRKEDLERACGPRTKGIMINTPANPSGKIFTREELEWVGDVAKRRDMFIFTDEIYEHFVYDGRKHLSPATLPSLRERTIMISGLSKTFAITGWRIGYAVCDAKWSRNIGFFNDLVYVCAPAPLQVGVAAGLNELPDSYYENLRREYQAKRDKVCGALDKAGLTPYVPHGAYYVLADISKIPGKTSKDRAMRLLKDTRVASVPGEAFYDGEGGETLTRFCFAKTDEVLDQACRNLEKMAGKRRLPAKVRR
jgi:aminotransferase